MEPELPQWLDATFLEAALQGEETGESVQLKVNTFSATMAVAAGENYTSHMYRVKVNYNVQEKKKSISLIVKVPFTKGVLAEMGAFYKKEPDMYNHFLPTVNSLTNCEFGPKSFKSSEHNVLVLSDLKDHGYVVCDRNKQLDFSHCEYVLKALAKFHAGSVACKGDRPDIIDMVDKETIYFENERFAGDRKIWLKETVKTVAEFADEIGVNKTLVNMLSSRVDAVADSVYRLCKPKVKGLNVLNHGDLWVNNILFKYSSSGGIADVMFIDFQSTRYVSPVMDVIHFLWTSADEDVRKSRLQELSEIYRLTLNSTLESLGREERLTATELREEFRDALDWGINVICLILPFLVCGPDDVINVEDADGFDFVKDGKINDKYIHMFRNKHYRALLPKVLEHFMDWMNFYREC